MSADRTGASRAFDGSEADANCWVCSRTATGHPCHTHRLQIMATVAEQSKPLPGYDTPGAARSTRRRSWRAAR